MISRSSYISLLVLCGLVSTHISCNVNGNNEFGVATNLESENVSDTVTNIVDLLEERHLRTDKEVLSPFDLVTYVESEENGFVKQRRFGSTIYKTTFQPRMYRGLKRAKLFEVTKPILDSIINRESPYLTFKFKITDSLYSDALYKGVNGQYQYGKRVEELAFKSLNKFKLDIESKKVNAIDAHFERNYTLDPGIVLLITFPVRSIRSDFVLIYDDALFKNGTIKFYFEKNNIEKLPNLKVIKK